MHTFLSAAQLVAATTTTTKKAQPSSGGSLLIFIIPLLVLAYLLIFRPQKQRARRQQQMQSSVEEGDMVATIGGIVGRVVAVSGERATVEVAPGVEMEFLRQAIARKVDAVAAPSTDWDGEEGDEDQDGEAPAEGGHDEDERGWHGFHPEEVDRDGARGAGPPGGAQAEAGGPGAAGGTGDDAPRGAQAGAGEAAAVERPDQDHLGRIYGVARRPDGADPAATQEPQDQVAPGEGGAPGERRGG